MGYRISISFVNGSSESVVLFSHWGGRGLLKDVEEYLKEAKQIVEKSEKDHPNYYDPFTRMDPDTIMVDFIRWLTKDMTTHVSGDLYLGATDSDGDNSDNGHHKIDLSSYVKKGYERLF